MIDRLFKSGIVTTVIGCLMCLGALWMYFAKRPIDECVILFGWGVTFLRSKDSLIGLK